jgi:chemotaxis protein CheD
MGDCRIGEPGQVLATFALGSCIGLAVYDFAARAGGLLHFMLPESALDPGRARENPYAFADTGVPLLLQGLYERGASRRRLSVCAAGGARMVEHGEVFAIGRKNYLALRRVLWKAGLTLHGEAVGGTASRTLKLDINSGRVWLHEAGSAREMLYAAAGEAPWLTPL